MSGIYFRPDKPPLSFTDLGAITAALQQRRASMAAMPTASLLDLLAAFGSRLLEDPHTRGLEGVTFLSAWLKRSNLEKMLALNLGGHVAALDGFVDVHDRQLAVKPHGLVSMWMAGNVPTLPVFALVPALLARNVCLVKLADPQPGGIDAMIDVLAGCSVGGLSGADLCACFAVVWYSSSESDLGTAMSLAADAKVTWGGQAAIEAIRRLPQKPHCVNVEFGPKYSIGLIGSALLEQPAALDRVVAAFVRDIAIFDQRACSSPQTIFVEATNGALADVGARFAAALERLPPKPALDAYTTVQIANTRAEWALDEQRDVIASRDGANWTVCMDADVSFKEAIQSRTVFLTAVDSWRLVVPLIDARVQTVGIAFGDDGEARDFAEAATLAGAARCVRPGLMNVQESPWDGKLLINELVRWVTLKV